MSERKLRSTIGSIKSRGGTAYLSADFSDERNLSGPVVERHGWLRGSLKQWASNYSPFRQIAGVSFRGVDLTSDDLRSLALPPTITYLDIADTEIDDTAIPMLLEMPALATLRLSGSKISSEGVKALRGRKATIAIADYDQDFEDLRALLDSMSGAFEPANSVDSGRGSKAELGRDTDGGPVVEADVAPQLDYQR